MNFRKLINILKESEDSIINIELSALKQIIENTNDSNISDILYNIRDMGSQKTITLQDVKTIFNVRNADFETDERPTGNALANPENGWLEGKWTENMTYDQAHKYLDNFPGGVLMHPGFEINNFVFLNNKKQYCFYDRVNNTVSDWDWNTMRNAWDDDDSYNILTDWWYSPESYTGEYGFNDLSYLNQLRQAVV